ncbi:MAG: hypothetical protein IKC32_06530 [Clostridia bacterium]|nr:hypothetical protein [Clostridia bacterium]
METVFYILAKSVEILLSLITFSMFMRVLLQFFVDVTESRLYAIALMISEPVVIPFRLLLAKLNVAQDTPIDIPFMLAYCFVGILLPMFLPII